MNQYNQLDSNTVDDVEDQLRNLIRTSLNNIQQPTNYRPIIMIPPINIGDLFDISGIHDEDLNDNKSENKPMKEEFKNTLDIGVICEKDIDVERSCAICQDQFVIGDKYVKLPCEGTPHFFHIGDSEECGGLFPWIENNNTCPLCRHEFPHEPESDIVISETNNSSEINDIEYNQNPETNEEPDTGELLGMDQNNILSSIFGSIAYDMYQQEDDELTATLLRSIEET